MHKNTLLAVTGLVFVLLIWFWQGWGNATDAIVMSLLAQAAIGAGYQIGRR